MLGVVLASEMNGGNIRRHMTLKINVGCLSLALEINDAEINVECLLLRSEINDGNIRLRMMLK